jgi:hypothetical protein
MQTMTILGLENSREQNTFETIFLNAGILPPLSALRQQKCLMINMFMYFLVQVSPLCNVMQSRNLQLIYLAVLRPMETYFTVVHSAGTQLFCLSIQYCHLQRIDLPAEDILWKDITSIDA